MEYRSFALDSGTDLNTTRKGVYPDVIKGQTIRFSVEG